MKKNVNIRFSVNLYLLPSLAAYFKQTLLKNSRDRALVKLRQSYRYNSDAAVKRMTNSQHLKSASLPLEFVTGQKVVKQQVMNTEIHFLVCFI